MRWMTFKLISFFAIFLFTQGAILPWVISNDTMPLWLDIILLSFIMLMWMIAIDQIAFACIKLFRKINDTRS